MMLALPILIFSVLTGWSYGLSSGSRSFSDTRVVVENDMITKVFKKHHIEFDQLSPKPRDYCVGCNRPLIQCLCDSIPNDKIILNTEILVLQHPVEFRRKTVSTVPLLKLVLERCKVMVGRSFDVELEKIIDDASSDGRIPILLFPGEDAITLEDSDALRRLDLLRNKTHAPISRNNLNLYLLIIVDGTWTQAKRMVRNSPVLNRCAKIQFMGTSDRSIYDSIRKQPDTFCLSTLESCVRTLKVLEPHSPQMKEAAQYLLDSLKSLVKIQMEQEQINLQKNPGSIRNSTKMELKLKRQNELNLQYASKAENSVPPCTKLSAGDEVKDLGNGYILRPLKGLSDAKFVDSRWPYRSTKSLKMIERQINADNVNSTRTGKSCCLGIEYKGGLIACIIRHRNGSLGILHVDAEHRRCGFGGILLNEATSTVIHRKDPTFAFIVDGNKESEALFTKMGWARADPNAKKGTG